MQCMFPGENDGADLGVEVKGTEESDENGNKKGQGKQQQQ